MCHLTTLERGRLPLSLKSALSKYYRGLDEVLQERNKINTLLRENIAGATIPWGIQVERIEMKDVELPEAMQQVMAMQAEANPEKRARLIKAEAELEAAKKLGDAAEQMANDPVAVELRRMAHGMWGLKTTAPRS